jgi:hypothetical protein
MHEKPGQKWVFWVRVAPFLTKLPKNNITANLIPMIISEELSKRQNWVQQPNFN